MHIRGLNLYVIFNLTNRAYFVLKYMALKTSLRSFRQLRAYLSSRGLSMSTAEKFPTLKLKRKSKYSILNDSDIAEFRKILKNDVGRVVTDGDQLEDYNVDWMRTCHGQSRLALLPKSTEELSDVLKYCNGRRLAVAPRGGNTGLVGGTVPVFDEIAVSMRLMNKVIDVNSTTGIVTCESGVVLDTLDQAIGEHGLTVPLDLGARHSCHIGGNIATNAGGVRLLRYGSLRANVLGLEFVTADGTIVDCLSTMRKDNTGYDVKSLMIGSEGTLGIISKVALLCPPKPKSVNVALFGLKEYGHVLELFKLSRQVLVEVMSAFEFFDTNSYDCVEKNLGYKIPLTSKNHQYYVLIETSGSNAEHDFEKLELLTNESLKTAIVGESDIVLASDLTQQRDIWRIREEIAVALQRDGYVYKFDISLPQLEFPNLHNAVKERLKNLSHVRVSSYGHVGDGNLHLNITSKQYDAQVMAALDPFIFQYVSKVGGSISAEHGLGLRKRHYIGYSKRPEAVLWMKSLKKLFDPNGILNPYKTVDPDLD